MPFIRFDNWRRLPGIEAEIWLHGDLKRTGVIDAASEDSTIAWVAADATGPRRLLERANGFELRISPEQLVLRAELQAHAKTTVIAGPGVCYPPAPAGPS